MVLKMHAAVLGSVVAMAAGCDTMRRNQDVGAPSLSITGGSALAARTASTSGIATGGGTVLAAPAFPTTIASFGFNGRQTTGLPSGADGRINYKRHDGVGRDVNVPVVLMAAEATPVPAPNGTGGRAVLVGDCAARGAECPSGALSVLASVEDNADGGAGGDVFQIALCGSQPALPPPAGCAALEGGVLRTGNIQVR